MTHFQPKNITPRIEAKLQAFATIVGADPANPIAFQQIAKELGWPSQTIIKRNFPDHHNLICRQPIQKDGFGLGSIVVGCIFPGTDHRAGLFVYYDVETDNQKSFPTLYSGLSIEDAIDSIKIFMQRHVFNIH